MRYDAEGKGTLVASGIPGDYVLAAPSGGLYVTVNGRPEAHSKAASASKSGRGEVWLVKAGKKRQVAAGLKLATGLAYRPDQWLLAVGEGASKWATSYQMEPDGSLSHPERYFWLHVLDGDDDAGIESACYAREGQILFATRSGVQIGADDGPTQVILPLPDRSRVQSACLGGRELDTLYAFAGEKIWRRKVKVHAMGAFTPWTKVNGTPL
jgi:sugar lactone lactonase YvrE